MCPQGGARSHSVFILSEASLSVFLLTHPQATIYRQALSGFPQPVPSDPLTGNVMKGLFITLQLGQLLQMFPIRQPPSHICSWLESEEKETRKKSLHFTQPLSHAQTPTAPPPPLPQTAEAHALRCQSTHAPSLLLLSPPPRASKPQSACPHPRPMCSYT